MQVAPACVQPSVYQCDARAVRQQRLKPVDGASLTHPPSKSTCPLQMQIQIQANTNTNGEKYEQYLCTCVYQCDESGEATKDGASGWCWFDPPALKIRLPRTCSTCPLQIQIQIQIQRNINHISAPAAPGPCSFTYFKIQKHEM